MIPDVRRVITEGHETVVIRGGRVLDPSTGRDEVGDVWIVDGRFAEAGKDLSATVVIPAQGQIVCPGLIDLHVHLREPGYEYRETLRSGAQAAAAGGYTTIACMADTTPTIDNAEVVRFVQREARNADARIYVVGAVTRGRKGEQLAEVGELVEAGAVALSDDDNAIENPAIMRLALEYTRMFDIPIFAHCDDPRLSTNGMMNESAVSTTLGLKGIPAVAEESIIARDLMLTELTGGRLHIAHVSTAGGITLIRAAKQRGLRVTADVTPHHLTLTDEALRTFDTSLKVSPPLRTNRDVEALRAGLKEGTIDAISSDHAPCSFDEKSVEYEVALFGAIGLETTLAIVLTDLVNAGHLSLMEAIRAMTANPARILGLAAGTLKVGTPADLTIFDPKISWTVEPERFLSKSRNTPFSGRCLTGRTTHTVLNGRVIQWSSVD